MTNTRERVLNRVQKLLALANGNANEHESQSAMLTAQRMMAENGLSMVDVELAKDVNEKVVATVDGSAYTRLSWWEKSLANIIGDNFRCFTYMQSSRGSRKMVFMGIQEDAEIASEVYRFAVEDIKYQSSRYLRSRGSQSSRRVANALKNDYILGYTEGLKSKFAEQVSTEGWGLVLVKDDALVQQHDEMSFRRDKSARTSRLGDNDAYSTGHRDGKNFDNNRKHITSGA